MWSASWRAGAAHTCGTLIDELINPGEDQVVAKVHHRNVELKDLSKVKLNLLAHGERRCEVVQVAFVN